jgi:uncharacterized protein YkwD
VQATKAGPGHRRPRRTSGARVALGPLTAVLVVLVLGAYGLGRMHDRAATQTLADPSGTACSPAQGALGAGCASSAPGIADGTGLSGGQPPAWPGSLPVRHREAVRTSLASPTPTTSPSSASPTPSPSPTPSRVASPGAPDDSAQSAASQVLAVINQARAQAGLPAYTLSAGLDASSRAHTLVMAGGCGLSHQCPGEAAVGVRLTQAGVAWSSFGENVGVGGPEPDTAAAIAQMAVTLTQDMLNEQPPDDGHRLNILSSSFRYVGISVLRAASGSVWMTQDFSG